MSKALGLGVLVKLIAPRYVPHGHTAGDEADELLFGWERALGETAPCILALPRMVLAGGEVRFVRSAVTSFVIASVGGKVAPFCGKRPRKTRGDVAHAPKSAITVRDFYLFELFCKKGLQKAIVCDIISLLYRGIVQSVEHQSPKLGVVGSSPPAPAKQKRSPNGDLFCLAGWVGRDNHRRWHNVPPFIWGAPRPKWTSPSCPRPPPCAVGLFFLYYSFFIIHHSLFIYLTRLF